MKTIVGLFDEFADAQRAVTDLEKAGFDRSRISLIANKDRVNTASMTDAPGSGPTQYGGDMATSTASGATTGAVLGGAAGLVAALIIPGVGPIIGLGTLATMAAGAGVGAVAGGLVGALVSAGVPESDAHSYEEGVRRGSTLVAVSADDQAANQAVDIMNRHNPIDIDQRRSQWRETGWTGPDVKRETGRSADLDTQPSFAGANPPDQFNTTPSTARHTELSEFTANTEAPAQFAGTGAGTVAAPGSAFATGASIPNPGQEGRYNEGASLTYGLTGDRDRPAEGHEAKAGEQTLDVIEEELQVGKREVETGGVRVRQTVEERPVEEQVNLREESVLIERRPVDRPADSADFNDAFREQTIEVTETAEVPVVAKEARVVEEVVLGKEATERTETVRDTVRRTDVDVEPVGAGEFDRYETDFRSNFQSSNPGASYDEARPAYQYGYELGQKRRGEWTSVESDARRDWEQRNPGSTWEKVKDAARYAYDRARDKVQH